MVWITPMRIALATKGVMRRTVCEGDAVKHRQGSGVNIVRVLRAAVRDVAVIDRESDICVVDAFQQDGQVRIVPRLF